MRGSWSILRAEQPLARLDPEVSPQCVEEHDLIFNCLRLQRQHLLVSITIISRGRGEISPGKPAGRGGWQCPWLWAQGSVFGGSRGLLVWCPLKSCRVTPAATGSCRWEQAKQRCMGRGAQVGLDVSPHSPGEHVVLHRRAATWRSRCKMPRWVSGPQGCCPTPSASAGP